MQEQFQLPPPSSWDTFESMCRDIFAIEWKDTQAKKNGRSGYPQNGVDVYGYTQDQRLHGVQCKGKDVAIAKAATEKELRQEVKKARGFEPKLASFTFTTTLSNDPNLEKVARKITEEHAVEGLFQVSYWGWNDLLDKISSNNDLIKKYYSWVLPENSADNFAYGLWSEYIRPKKLFYNACYLPFRTHQVNFRPNFIENLSTFYNYSALMLHADRTKGLNDSLRAAIDNFKRVASDLIDNATIDMTRPDACSETYLYWVEKGDLPYLHQADYVDFKRAILKFLFYQLIVAANYVIDIKNRVSERSIPQHEYVNFTQDFDTPSSFYLPMYPDDAASDGKLYPGLEWIRSAAQEGLTDPVVDFEEAIASGQSTRPLL